jgi:hypothetical protein
VDLIAPSLASSALPLPNAPAADARAWFAGNQPAATVTGVLQVASVLALAAFGNGMRIFAWIAAVPALASVISLVLFEGAALILLGRLLCMVWIIAAVISPAWRRATAPMPWSSTG